MENTIKMLIAEDSAEFADVGTEVYEEFGVSPSFCEKDGTALLEEIRKQSPDVVVMDMFMKNIDAVGVMKNARRNSMVRRLSILHFQISTVLCLKEKHSEQEQLIM